MEVFRMRSYIVTVSKRWAVESKRPLHWPQNMTETQHPSTVGKLVKIAHTQHQNQSPQHPQLHFNKHRCFENCQKAHKLNEGTCVCYHDINIFLISSNHAISKSSAPSTNDKNFCVLLTINGKKEGRPIVVRIKLHLSNCMQGFQTMQWSKNDLKFQNVDTFSRLLMVKIILLVCLVFVKT